MKKLKFLLFLPLLILLVACSKNPRDEFISRYNNNLKQEETSFIHSVKMTDLKLPNDGVAMPELENLKNKVFIFNVSQSLKDKIFSISSDLSQLDPSYPKLDVIGTNDDFYINAEFWGMFSGIKNDNIKDRYVNVADFSEDYGHVFDDVENSNDLANSFKKLDAKKFKKDGDAIVLTVKISELLEMIKDMSKDDSANTYFNMMTAYIDDSSLVTYQLEKDGSANVTIDLKMAEGLDNAFESITIEIVSKKVKYIAPKVPSTSKIISLDELQIISSEVYQAELTDEEFQELFNQIKDNLSFYSKEDLMKELEFYRQFLTEEQYQKLEALIATAA
ncbi:hypothetical protein [Streptococcus marimammalium]|uniref:hypothetical protein n=1 Tax=Streptococcus marimammalium TaxID=269666 RepID=UPI00036B89E3|nr:hypothetical protein [Streptococcus marimammalium]